MGLVYKMDVMKELMRKGYTKRQLMAVGLGEKALHDLHYCKPIVNPTLVTVCDLLDCQPGDILANDKVYKGPVIKEMVPVKPYYIINIRDINTRAIISALEHSGISRSTVYKILHGEKVTPRIATKIADYLGCDVNDIATMAFEERS